MCWVRNRLYGGVVHGRGRVDLDQPDMIVLIDHEIVSEHLMRVLPVFNELLCGLQRPFHNILHLRLNFLNNP
jgi:hypothetical protein